MWLAAATQTIMAFQLIDVSSHHLRWFDAFFDSVAQIFHIQAFLALRQVLGFVTKDICADFFANIYPQAVDQADIGRHQSAFVTKWSGLSTFRSVDFTHSVVALGLSPRSPCE